MRGLPSGVTLRGSFAMTAATAKQTGMAVKNSPGSRLARAPSECH